MSFLEGNLSEILDFSVISIYLPNILGKSGKFKDPLFKYLGNWWNIFIKKNLAI